MSGRFPFPLLLISVLICGCGQPSGSRSSQQAAALTPVSVRLEWVLRGHTLPLVVAREKGWYAARRLQVTVTEGKGDALTCELVSNGEETFGVADASTGAVAISKGAAIRYLAVFVQNNPSSIIAHPDQSIRSPQDLRGKRGGISPAGAATILFQALLSKHGIRKDELNLASMDPRAKHAALLNRQVNYINGFLLGDYLSVHLEEPELVAIPYYQWGVNALGTGLIAHPDTIRERPQLVRDFVAATMEGLVYTQEHPQEAAAIGAQAFPLTDPVLLERSIELTAPLLHTPRTLDKPLGWMAEEDWRETVELMHSYGGSDSPRELRQYYTNRFLE